MGNELVYDGDVLLVDCIEVPQDFILLVGEGVPQQLELLGDEALLAGIPLMSLLDRPLEPVLVLGHVVLR